MKGKRPPKPPPLPKEKRSSLGLWEKVGVDSSGKFRTASFQGNRYYTVFVCYVHDFLFLTTLPCVYKQYFMIHMVHKVISTLQWDFAVLFRGVCKAYGDTITVVVNCNVPKRPFSTQNDIQHPTVCEKRTQLLKIWCIVTLALSPTPPYVLHVLLTSTTSCYTCLLCNVIYVRRIRGFYPPNSFGTSST